MVHKNHWRQVSLLLQPSNKKWWEDPDVIVAWVLNIFQEFQKTWNIWELRRFRGAMPHVCQLRLLSSVFPWVYGYTERNNHTTPGNRTWHRQIKEVPGIKIVKKLLLRIIINSILKSIGKCYFFLSTFGGSVALILNGAGAAAGAAIQLRFFTIAVAIIFYCIHQIVRRIHKVWPCHSQKYFHGN